MTGVLSSIGACDDHLEAWVRSQLPPEWEVCWVSAAAAALEVPSAPNPGAVLIALTDVRPRRSAADGTLRLALQYSLVVRAAQPRLAHDVLSELAFATLGLPTDDLTLGESAVEEGDSTEPSLRLRLEAVRTMARPVPAPPVRSTAVQLLHLRHPAASQELSATAAPSEEGPE